MEKKKKTLTTFQLSQAKGNAVVRAEVTLSKKMGHATHGKGVYMVRFPRFEPQGGARISWNVEEWVS